MGVMMTGVMMKSNDNGESDCDGEDGCNRDGSGYGW